MSAHDTQIGGDFVYALGAKGTGLWYPGHCFSLIVCRLGDAEEKLVKSFSELLPNFLVGNENENP